jgi:hypothetical protein
MLLLLLLLLLLQAARRTEKRRLLGFIRLLDYMVADCMHSMVVASLQHALQCLQGHAAAAAAADHAAEHQVRPLASSLASSSALACINELSYP